MVRKYKKKTNRQTWAEENMKRVLEEIFSKRMGYKKADQSFHVQQCNLEEKAKQISQGTSIVFASHSCRSARFSA
jgi:shikimate kinase